MLTRITSVISIAILAVGATVALDAAPASAGGPGCTVNGCSGVHGGYRKTFPVRSGRPGHGGGGGNAGPPPCPPNTNCNTLGLGNAAPAAAQVRTIDVAWDARNQLHLPAPHIHTSPHGKTYVQLKTGLWLPPGDFKQETAPASAGGQTVTAIGDPLSVTWNMGEGSVTCRTAGSPGGTQCGYTYQRSSAGQPNRKYAISVTATWNIHWTCAGVGCDDLNGTYAAPTMSMTTNATLAVGEVQTESRPG